MRWRSFILSALIGGLGLPAAADEPQQPWHDTFEAAQQAAKDGGVPLLVHFYAEWCGPCRRMDAEVLDAADVTEHLGTGIVAVRIDVDQRSDLAERFAVAGLPADVVLAPDGTTLATNRGYLPVTEYAAWIRTHSEKRAITQPVVALEEGTATGPAPGLGGFSPVSITRDRVWRTGDREFSWAYRGVVYHLVDAEELETFRADPHQFVPRLEGYDPLELATTSRFVSGDIRYGAFYDRGLYLHSSLENRRRFIESPHEYIGQAQNILSEQAGVVTMHPPAR